MAGTSTDREIANRLVDINERLAGLVAKAIENTQNVIALAERLRRENEELRRQLNPGG